MDNSIRHKKEALAKLSKKDLILLILSTSSIYSIKELNVMRLDELRYILYEDGEFYDK